MKLVIISDTHEQHHGLVIPPCDVLISCGDYSNTGAFSAVHSFHDWLSRQPATHIISVQGNHEMGVARMPEVAANMVREIDRRIIFIEEGELIICGYKFWCSAFTPKFMNWAYMKERGEPIKRHWDRIPGDTEILITHGPPQGILDQAQPDISNHLGCYDLRVSLDRLPELKLHAFGHIHGSSGGMDHGGIRFFNAAICDEEYNAVNAPKFFVLPDKKEKQDAIKN